MLVDVCEHHACTIGKTIGSHVLLNEIDVLLKELRLISSSYQINLVANYDYWYAEIAGEHTIRQR